MSTVSEKIKSLKKPKISIEPTKTEIKTNDGNNSLRYALVIIGVLIIGGYYYDKKRKSKQPE